MGDKASSERRAVQVNDEPSRQGKLVMCPTPLGNLGDMTPRALDELRCADLVCCEDTRVTGRLLSAFGIHARTERLDEASIDTKADGVVARVLAGERVVFCSDAGMPGVSDPGQRLVERARAAGAAVEVLPGASAATCAYVASGFSCPRFYFGGFFPRKAGERTRCLAALARLDAVLVFYESPRRVAGALSAIADAFPARRVAACRELTKLHEEVLVGAAGAVAAEFARREQAGEVRGEFVLVVDAPAPSEEEARAATAHDAARARARELAAAGDASRKDIARILRDEFGIPRNDAYRIAMDAVSA